MITLKGITNFVSALSALYVGGLIVMWIYRLIKSFVIRLRKGTKITESFDSESMKDDFFPLFAIFNIPKVKKYFEGKDFRKYCVVSIVIWCGLFYFMASLFIHTETIGSYFEKEEYTTYYYVNLFPSEDSIKNYRVKAQIHAVVEEYEDTNQDGDTTTYSERVYYIEEAYFNPGTISFYDSSGMSEDGLVVGRKVSITADDGKEWWVELTKEKAE